MSNPSASEKSDIRRAALARRAALGAAERAAAAKAIIAPCLGLAASHRLGPCKVPFCLWPGTRKAAAGTRCGGNALGLPAF